MTNDETYATVGNTSCDWRWPLCRVVLACLLFAFSMVTPVYSSGGPGGRVVLGWEIAHGNIRQWPSLIMLGAFNPKQLLGSPVIVNGLFILVIVADVASLFVPHPSERRARVAKWMAIVAFAFACVGVIRLIFGFLLGGALGTPGSSTRLGAAMPLWFLAFTIQLIRPRQQHALL